MIRRINWLHLSDLHLRAGDTYDQDVVLQSLIDDIRSLVTLNKIHFIFITGDLAATGKAEEYNRVKQFLADLMQASSVSPKNVICVPGNHDIDRSLISQFSHSASETLSARDVVSQLLGNSAELSLFTRRLDGYRRFIEDQFPWGKSLEDNTLLSFTHNFVVDNVRLSVLALNSAWLAGSDADKGHIIIGERQVRKALEKVESSDIIIALLHHPLSYLKDFDAGDVQLLLNRRCDFVLHGHIHELGALNVKSPDSEVFYLAAGATYEGRRETLAYNLVTLDLDNGAAAVVLRQYSDRTQAWHADTGAYITAPDGLINVSLPERLSHKPQSAIPSVISKRAARFSHVEDQAPALAEVTEPTIPDVPVALIEALKANKCILFAGAGASLDAKLPTWYELVEDLVAKTIDAGTVEAEESKEMKCLLGRGDVLILAEFCRHRLGEFAFSEYLKNRLSDSNRASTTHRLLSRIPFRAAATTNFDPFLEHSRPRAKVILPDMMENLGGPGAAGILQDETVFPVLKIHGSYDTPSSIVLTPGDFRAILFKRPKYREFLVRLFTDTTIFFYGYSFRDPNVDFVLQQIMSLYEGMTRPHYALVPNPGRIKKNYLLANYNIRAISYELWKDDSHVAATAFLEVLGDMF